MWLQEIKFLVAGFSKHPLPLICGLLTGVCGFLWIENNQLRDGKETMIESCAERVSRLQREHKVETDSIKARELRKTEDQNRKLNDIIISMKKTKR